MTAGGASRVKVWSGRGIRTLDPNLGKHQHGFSDSTMANSSRKVKHFQICSNGEERLILGGIRCP